MKKYYIVPSFKAYSFEPESEFLGTSPGQVTETDTSVSGGADDNTVIGGGGRGDAAGYRSNLWD